MSCSPVTHIRDECILLDPVSCLPNLNMDLTFDQTLNSLNKEIKKENKALRNRLQSILFDHRFLEEQVLALFPNYPLIPNERCGLWYCDPERYSQTSYFKSTDGHSNQWDFSLRRLNLHLLPTITQKGGIVIVDSTRRGKRMPDALSKTVPIWCAVLNSIMLEGRQSEEEVLFCPPNTVSGSEFERIKSRIPSLVARFKELGLFTSDELFKILDGKILRPIWVYPGASLLNSHRDPFTGDIVTSTWEAQNENFIPVVLCTVSYQCQDGVDKRHGFTYVQGAADDHELWAEGLTAELFWQHIEIFKDTALSDQELSTYVNNLVTSGDANNKLTKSLRLDDMLNANELTRELHLGQVAENIELDKNLVDQLKLKYSLVVLLSTSISVYEEAENIRIFKLQSGSKKSSRALRAALTQICPLIEANLQKSLPVLICCNNGKDMSVCVVLSVLCRNFNVESWQLEQSPSVHKSIIKKHLAKMITKLDGRNLNPPRVSLNSVNDYLM